MKTVLVCLVSGGMDSITACVENSFEYGVEPEALLSISYGQRHSVELMYARKLAEYYGWKHKVIEVPQMEKEQEVWGDLDKEPPRGKTSHTYSPQRNLMLISVAVRFLEYRMREALDGFVHGVLSLGFHRTDWHPGEPVYPDTRPEFLNALELAANLGSGIVYDGRGWITLSAPYIMGDKTLIVKEAFRLGVPLHLTWTCYRGGDKPCGKCPACKTRLNAFMRAGIPDPRSDEYDVLPTEYAKWYGRWQAKTGKTALLYWLENAGKSKEYPVESNGASASKPYE